MTIPPVSGGTSPQGGVPDDLQALIDRLLHQKDSPVSKEDHAKTHEMANQLQNSWMTDETRAGLIKNVEDQLNNQAQAFKDVIINNTAIQEAFPSVSAMSGSDIVDQVKTFLQQHYGIGE